MYGAIFGLSTFSDLKHLKNKQKIWGVFCLLVFVCFLSRLSLRLLLLLRKVWGDPETSYGPSFPLVNLGKYKLQSWKIGTRPSFI